MGDVTVTQADREAAASNILKRLIHRHGGEQPWMDASTQSMRLGEQDDHWEVQAFARHRLSAQTPEPATQQPRADVVEAARQAIAEYRESPFRSADWLAGRMMDIFNSDETKGGSPCTTTAARTFSPLIQGVGRDAENEQSLVVYCRARPTDQQLEEIHTALRTQAPASDEVREAFKAGWRTNAVGEDVHPASYLDGCEQTDWEEYQRVGIHAYCGAIASEQEKG